MLRRSRVVSSRKDVALVSQAYPTISTVGGTFGLSSSSHMVRPAVQGHIGLATAAFFAIAPTMRLSCELAASFCISERQRVACLCSRDLQSIVNGSIWRASLPDEVRPIHFLRTYTPKQMMDKVQLRFNLPADSDEVRGRRLRTCGLPVVTEHGRAVFGESPRVARIRADAIALLSPCVQRRFSIY